MWSGAGFTKQRHTNGRVNTVEQREQSVESELFTVSYLQSFSPNVERGNNQNDDICYYDAVFEDS
jgi:hypothetical protein